ncbi:MAG: hypothetical protein LBH19_11465 [Dysgonamonadaceae bacterium]|jgi:hypothetical protein|nr:hypothetical protein [Dysgonamonadaceae bacterium]
MKAVNKSLEPVLRSAVAESLKNYELTHDGNFLSDLYLYCDVDNQALIFYDDVERELFSIHLNDTAVVWGEDILQEVKDTAKYVLRGLKEDGAFGKEFICKPFTVSLIDRNFMVEEELMFLDDNIVKAGSDLWAGMNRELDEFLKNLMK